ncbi:MAG: MoxR family ATPase, partial [Ruminococcus sp.]|nr:MoxR family ATPase [Ruminococcus sp.]
VMHVDDVVAMQEEVRRVRVSDEVKQYVVSIVDSTRGDRNTTLGISPRGSIALYKAAKAFTYINEREYVTPDDVKNTAVSVLSHRIILSPQGKSQFGTPEEYVKHVLASCAVPSVVG